MSIEKKLGLKRDPKTGLVIHPNGKLIPKGLEETVLKDMLVPDDLKFPSTRHVPYEKTSPNKIQWLNKYYVYRTAIPTPTDEQCEEYYDRINIDNNDDINRFRGSLLGLALGDALGTTVEFMNPGTFEPVTDIVGGGPFGLKAGQWTDDTSMMYCIAHSLMRQKAFDPKDQMDLFCKWWQDGVFSVTGECFDIGNTVRDALQRYMQTGNPIAGSTDPMSAGNGSLMRLAPVPIFAFDDFAKAVELSGESSKTTHGAVEAVDACRYYGGLIWGALHGEPKEKLLNGLYSPDGHYWESNSLCDSIRNLILSGNYKTKPANQIRASGYVMHSLEAALWAFHNSDSFEEGALKAVNLGEDADTTGAIYGQLAGAYYGERVIDFKWIRKLSNAPIFYLKAQELKEIVISMRE